MERNSGELAKLPYWRGDCSILARSPQTDQLALWCHKMQQNDNPQEFLVLEPETPPGLHLKNQIPS